ncbi:DUF1318 domain-containing protein [Rheinheimera riviphila]|uniref:DUF1318 domain-containing protein n=1 Tax=Rheinheimera riviphila TaxID=1834037 RepID=A0A437QJ70_9GAMM|nr:YdbL family protein [Rheinheimera riviphila]RVU34520.1 DUF1318 domain-containing protein [Rheinheimera riviphila]
MRKLIGLTAMLLLLSQPLQAMDLQQAMTALPTAKAQGLVGEQPDGYLGVVKASTDTASVVQLINNARRAEYQKLATANGLQLADVEVMAGQKALEKTQSGHFILRDGQWVKK